MNQPNDGSRPSRLAVGRAITGEAPLSPEQAGNPAVDDWRSLVAAAVPPPFDAAALRRAAEQLTADPPGGEVVRLFKRAAPLVAGGVLMAAGLLFALQPHERTNRLKGGSVELGFDVRRDDRTFAGDATVRVRAGDQLRFDYAAGAASSVVLVGVDGTGTVQTYWPDMGAEPVEIAPGRGVLEGSILLDDAPGPEVFVASFTGESATAVAQEVRAAFASGGVGAVLRLDEARPDLAVLVLDKE